MNIISGFAGKVLLSVAAAGAVFAPFAASAQDNQVSKPGVDVSIGAKGRVLVHGATVTAVAGSVVTATTQWGGTTITWNVNDANAKILYKGGKDANSSVIVTGDVINFDGAMATTGSFAVNASIVRDMSKEKVVMEKHVFSGTISTAPASTTPTSFKFTVGSTVYTVNVPVGISVLGKNWLSLPIGSFVAGDKVNVYGAVQAASTTTIDASVVRNTSR